MANTTAYTGAAALWDAGYTGAGVDVALIDTGVSRVEGLATPGKVIYGPDLSLESQAPDLRNLDTNGHGTFMAGLIAGKDAGLSAPYSDAPASAYRGMAPDARIVSVKVGVADGGVDVSQVIAAIDWVVQHRNDNDLNIRVINLSYGTNIAQPSDDRPARVRGRAGLEGGHLRRRGRRQLRLPEPHEQRPGAGRPGHRPLPHGGRVVRLRGHDDDRRRLGAGLLAVAEAWRDARRRPRRTGRAPAGTPRPEELQRPQPSGRPDRQPLLPRQRDVRVGGDRVRRGGAALPDVPDREAGPDQEAADQRRRHHQRQGTGHRRWRAAAPADPHDEPAGLGPDVARLHRDRDPRGRPRPRSPDQRRRRPDRRAGHLRPGLRLARDGRASRPTTAAGRAARGTATAGPAARGRATAGPATRGPATPGPATAGPATAGRATRGRATAGPATRWSGNSWSGNSWSGNSWSTASWD